MVDGTFMKPTTTNGILLVMVTISADRLEDFKKQFPGVYQHASQYLDSVVRILHAPYRSGYITDSTVEGTNSAIGNARKHEVIYVLELFLKFCFSQFKKQIDELKTNDNEELTNRILSEKRYFESAQGYVCTKQRIPNTYVVTSPFAFATRIDYFVKINPTDHTIMCSCLMPSETLSPCIHAIQAMKQNNILITKDNYDPIYHRNNNIQAYTEDMLRNLPIIENLVPDHSIVITNFNKRPGRPKKIQEIQTNSWNCI